MDILYIIGENCSECGYNELRYSLRSIEQYGKNVGRVFVAGYCPDFLSDEVIKVPCEQPYKYEEIGDSLSLVEKHCNILHTLMFAVDNTDISDEFLISMDDHIYIRRVDFDKYPFYVKKYGAKNELPVVAERAYGKLLASTRAICESQQLSVAYSTLHRNMHHSRKIINECRGFLNEVISKKIPLEYNAYLINYRYSHKRDFKFRPVKDVKVHGGDEWYKADSSKTECFSTTDFAPGIGLDCLISGMFPKKSKYER